MTTEHATETKEEDWTLIMEICDMINDTDEGLVHFDNQSGLTISIFLN